MKFKARVCNVNLFSKLAQTVEKLGKSCILHISPKKIQIILTSDITDGIQLWAGLNTSSVFSDAIVQSLNNNEISLEVNLDYLHRALKSAESAQDVIVKLTKKNNTPYLSFSIEIHSSQMMTVTHDIPITILTPMQFAQYSEPSLPDPHVHIMMPPLRLLRPVIDKMKNISDYVTVQANMAGEFNLQVTTDTVEINTGLEHPAIDGRPPHTPDSTRECGLKVDIKKFHRFLFSYLVCPTNVICCMVKNRALVLHVILEDLFLTYYIPLEARDGLGIGQLCRRASEHMKD